MQPSYRLAPQMQPIALEPNNGSGLPVHWAHRDLENEDSDDTSMEYSRPTEGIAENALASIFSAENASEGTSPHPIPRQQSRRVPSRQMHMDLSQRPRMSLAGTDTSFSRIHKDVARRTFPRQSFSSESDEEPAHLPPRYAPPPSVEFVEQVIAAGDTTDETRHYLAYLKKLRDDGVRTDWDFPHPLTAAIVPRSSRSSSPSNGNWTRDIRTPIQHPSSFSPSAVQASTVSGPTPALPASASSYPCGAPSREARPPMWDPPDLYTGGRIYFAGGRLLKSRPSTPDSSDTGAVSASSNEPSPKLRAEGITGASSSTRLTTTVERSRKRKSSRNDPLIRLARPSRAPEGNIGYDVSTQQAGVETALSSSASARTQYTVAQVSVPARALGRKRRRGEGAPQEMAPASTRDIPWHSSARRASNGASSLSYYFPEGRSLSRIEPPMFTPGSELRSVADLMEHHDPHMPEAVRLQLSLAYANHHNLRRPATTTLLPPLRLLSTPSLLFTSELLPRGFNARKRLDILHIFRTKATYVPACISIASRGPSVQYHVVSPMDSSSNHSTPFDAPLGQDGVGWPKDSIPMEVFLNIAAYLPRDALQSLRLINREFEKKTSCSVFRNVVVPFGPQIWDLMVHDGSVPGVDIVDIKGKGKAREVPVEKDVTVHDGMKVFQAWGRHIRKFAMAFDAEEEQLVRPPSKGKFESFKAFWGDYQWPHPYYSRFEFCAGLEKKADEFRAMTAALSNLKGVRELGISVDSGLGWLCGPDVSDHAQLFEEKPKVFGATNPHGDAKSIERQNTWDAIVLSLGGIPSSYTVEGDDILDGGNILNVNEWGFYEVIVKDKWDNSRMTNYSVVQFHNEYGMYGGKATDRPLVFQGVNLANTLPLTNGDGRGETINLSNLSLIKDGVQTPFSTAPLVPNKLTIAQKEWLLETEWAQRAFLSSYCMALTDNSQTFQHVTSLTVAKLSSRYLSALQRQDVWKALPKLNSLTINVSADWRDIFKTDSGLVDTVDIQPSDAATQFFTLLTTCVAPHQGIKKLSIGYLGGGERQKGIFGRNRFVLPAPLTDFSDRNTALSHNANILALPYVEHLTLANCWITPPAFKNFITKMRVANLRSLTLDSVSLTAHSGVMDSNEPDPLEDGINFSRPQGLPLYGDPTLGNLFEQRGPAPEPKPDGWVIKGGRIGSWGNVLDFITPGPTRDFVRYTYQYRLEAPVLNDSFCLEQIDFISCGYVKLVNMKAFSQLCIGDVNNNPPACLEKRALSLMPVMMHRPEDDLLGQIVPLFNDNDKEIFDTAFPMKLGWDETDDSKWDARDDGQPTGGSGRFTGHVERLNFDAEHYRTPISY